MTDPTGSIPEMQLNWLHRARADPGDCGESDDDEDEPTDGDGPHCDDGHKFDPKTLLTCLELSALLRNPDHLHRVVKLAATLLGPEAEDSAACLQLPSRNALGRARVRLDLIMLHWHRLC